MGGLVRFVGRPPCLRRVRLVGARVELTAREGPEGDHDSQTREQGGHCLRAHRSESCLACDDGGDDLSDDAAGHGRELAAGLAEGSLLIGIVGEVLGLAEGI